MARNMILAATLLAVCGCASLRYLDYKTPAARFDHATNRPLPEVGDPAVDQATEIWRGMSETERAKFPTPYHVYVDTPEPGTFEGTYTIGIAFSGGGTRGTVFGAACLKEVAALGDILVETPSGPTRINPLEEVDYVSGVSTGAIPAALFALDRTPDCPPEVRFDRWPDCFNKDVTAFMLRRLAFRPHWVLRDFAFGLNTRPALSSAIAAAFFDGKPFRLDSGLTFRHLPATPIVLLPATIINDPGTPLVQTRLPYRFALDLEANPPWSVGVQSFETFHSDPMAYALGEACYNSLSFPGQMHSGLIGVRPDRGWVFKGLPPDTVERMRRARTQPGYAHTYEVKDGGLVDNRGIQIIARLFEYLTGRGPSAGRPLLLALDAGWLELRPVQQGTRYLRKGWLKEFTSSALASWQAHHRASLQLAETYSNTGCFDCIRFGFSAWCHYLRPQDGSKPEGPYKADEGTPEGRYLEALCLETPGIGNPQRLLDVCRTIGTRFSDLDATQLAAIEVAVRFTVWLQQGQILEWASQCHGGAPARFVGSSTTPDA